jgi:hypothetical protein
VVVPAGTASGRKDDPWAAVLDLAQDLVTNSAAKERGLVRVQITSRLLPHGGAEERQEVKENDKDTEALAPTSRL